MHTLKKIAIVLAALIAILILIAFLLPRRAHVERSTVIQAPRATVFTLLNGYKTFNKWSPWYSLDPQADYTYSGPEQGVGAKMNWESEKPDVGTGSQEIVESKPWDLVRTRLDFGSQGTADAFFKLTPEEPGTRVVWGFDTDLGMNPVSRYFGLFFDRMIGSDYEKGLAGLKQLAEGLPKVDFSDLKAEVITVAPMPVAFVSTSSSKDDQAIAAAIGKAYATVQAFMKTQRLSQSGPPLTINTVWDDRGYEFDAAIPFNQVPEGGLPKTSSVKVKQTYEGRAIKVVHRGSYHNMRETYDKLFAYAAASGLEQNGSPWDEYVSDPGNTPEPELITHVYIPVK